MRRVKALLETPYLKKRYELEDAGVIEQPNYTIKQMQYIEREPLRQAYYNHLEKTIHTFWWTQASEKERDEVKARLRKLYSHLPS